VPSERVAFWLTVILAGATVWIVPRLPLADLPQHAGQIALWHDLTQGTSKWQSLVQVNYFTPYLVGCSLALLLSFIIPVSAALKLLLALSYYGFVLGCIALGRRMGTDRRLDWLFVTGFFGLAYLYGFFPFLIALPIGLAFMALAHRHAERPTAASGALLAVTGLVLFFSHGLVFAFATVVAEVAAVWCDPLRDAWPAVPRLCPRPSARGRQRHDKAGLAWPGQRREPPDVFSHGHAWRGLASGTAGAAAALRSLAARLPDQFAEQVGVRAADLPASVGRDRA
jgi:hypothetical protein